MSLSGKPKPILGLIGGSGLTSFPELKELYRFLPETRYGFPSDEIQVCEYAGVLVAFLPRHGKKHSIAPHKVPYKANVAALKSIGVKTIVATCIVGSLKPSIEPGSFVLPDQFVNLTWGRDNYVEQDDGRFVHLPMAEPYCAKTRNAIARIIKGCDYSLSEQGTVAVIQGPRFSTRAESEFFIRNGWDIVNMTQYPECYLARELGLCYASIASVTDYDVGLPSGLAMKPDTMGQVLGVFRNNIKKTKNVLLGLIEHEAQNIVCGCAKDITKTYL